MKVNAIVLAGGKLKDKKEGNYKSFLPMGNSTMLFYVLDALKKSELVNKIVVTSLPANKSIEGNGFDVVPAQDNLIASITNVLSGLPENKTLLVASDIPLITGNIINKFIDECSKKNADFYYPLIPKSAIDSRFTGMKRTYFKVKEGTFTGGNIIMIDNSLFVDNKDLAKQIFDKRKKPVSLAKILGAKFLLKFLSKSLTLPEAEKKAGEIIGGTARAIIFSYPEIGVDVDKISDYELVKNLLS